jgi:GDP-L-fucose synthase
MNTILITGGNGLVGSAIKKITKNDLLNNYIFLGRKDGDLKNEVDVDKIFQKYNPTYVIHLAANVGGLFKNLNNNLEMYYDNLKMNQNILKYAHKYNVKKLIACLSTCIFPDKTTYPINEKMLHNGPPHSSNEGYSYAKRLLEIECKLYNDKYGTNFVCIIPTNVYGPHDNFSLEDGHVIPALIHKAYIASKNNSKLIVYGSGRPLRQFIYSEDLGKLILWSLDNYKEQSPIIFSPKEVYSIKNTAEIIAKNFNDLSIEYDLTKSDGQFKKDADNTKLMSLYSDFEFTSLNDGLKKTIEWFNKNYDNSRK